MTRLQFDQRSALLKKDVADFFKNRAGPAAPPTDILYRVDALKDRIEKMEQDPEKVVSSPIQPG